MTCCRKLDSYSFRPAGKDDSTKAIRKYGRNYYRTTTTAISKFIRNTTRKRHTEAPIDSSKAEASAQVGLPELLGAMFSQSTPNPPANLPEMEPINVYPPPSAPDISTVPENKEDKNEDLGSADTKDPYENVLDDP